MLDGHISLGYLYARQGLPGEAKQTFAFVFEEYKKSNKMREAGAGRSFRRAASRGGGAGNDIRH